MKVAFIKSHARTHYALTLMNSDLACRKKSSIVVESCNIEIDSTKYLFEYVHGIDMSQCKSHSGRELEELT